MVSVTFPVGTTHLVVDAWLATIPAMGGRKAKPDYARKVLFRVWDGAAVEMVATNQLACFRTRVELSPVQGPPDTQIVVDASHSSIVSDILKKAKTIGYPIRVSVGHPEETSKQFTLDGFDFESIVFTTGGEEIVLPGTGSPPFRTEGLFGRPPRTDFEAPWTFNEHTSLLAAPLRVVGDLHIWAGDDVLWAVPAESPGFQFEAAVVCVNGPDDT